MGWGTGIELNGQRGVFWEERSCPAPGPKVGAGGTAPRALPAARALPGWSRGSRPGDLFSWYNNGLMGGQGAPLRGSHSLGILTPGCISDPY